MIFRMRKLYYINDSAAVNFCYQVNKKIYNNPLYESKQIIKTNPLNIDNFAINKENIQLKLSRFKNHKINKFYYKF